MILFKVRKRNRQDLLAKKEALDLDVASLRLNDNSVPQKYVYWSQHNNNDMIMSIGTDNGKNEQF